MEGCTASYRRRYALCRFYTGSYIRVCLVYVVVSSWRQLPTATAACFRVLRLHSVARVLTAARGCILSDVGLEILNRRDPVRPNPKTTNTP